MLNAKLKGVFPVMRVSVVAGWCRKEDLCTKAVSGNLPPMEYDF